MFSSFKLLRNQNRFRSTSLGHLKLNNNSIRRSYSKNQFPPYLLNVPPTNVTTLPSRLRVASEETFGETATVGVWIDSGSAYETEANNGVAHFLEHLSFKGTSKRTKVQLEEEIENIGGVLNAYTSREQTVYYAKVFKKDVPQAVDILSDILLNSKFDPDAIQSERSTILREMEEVNKDEHEVIFDMLHNAAFQGTALGRTILGPEENIRKLQRKDLVDFVQANYHAPRMVLTAAGAVKHEELVRLAEKSFSSLASTSNPAHPDIPFTGSMITYRDDAIPDLHFALAVESVGWSHPDFYTFLVLQTLVGSWDRNLGGGKHLSSRICEVIAEEHLASSFSSFCTTFHNTGLFGFYLTTTAEEPEDVVVEALAEWGRLARAVSEQEVERAKTKLKTSLLMNLDGSTAIAEDIGRQVLTHGRRLTPAEVFMRIEAITVNDVKRVASTHLTDVDPAVVALGSTVFVPDYNKIRDWTFQRKF